MKLKFYLSYIDDIYFLDHVMEYDPITQWHKHE